MSKHAWRLLAALAALACGLLITAPAANAKVPTDRAGYHAWTQDSLSRCMTVDPDTGNHSIDVPASVQQAAWQSRALGYHRVGGVQLTGNGLPTVRLVAPRVRTTITLSTGVQQQTWHTPTIRRAWVPGYAGSSCSTWTLIEWAD